MSHKATKWAFDQPEVFRDMKPSEWAVLIVLADCHNPILGCFPSQEYICSKTNIGERTVRDQLIRLRERGLVNWEEVRTDGKRSKNRYSLAFEDDFQPANSAGSSTPVQPAEIAGSSTGETEPVQPADSDSFNRQNLPPNLVSEPVKRTVERDARASDGAKAEPRIPDADLLEKLRAFAPTVAQDSVAETDTVWCRLSREERREAVERYPDWLADAKKNGRGRLAGLPTYLAEKRWARLPAKAPAEASGNASTVPAFSRAWWWVLHRVVEKAVSDGWAAKSATVRTEVRLRGEAALRYGGGWPIVPESRDRIVEAAEALRQVPKDGPEAIAWRNYYLGLGVAMPLPERVDWIFLPAEGPPKGPEDYAAVAEGLGR